MTEKPLDGAISRYYETEAPEAIRTRIAEAKKGEIVEPGYPYRRRLDGDVYDAAYARLQSELVKMQAWVRDSGARVVIVFEGRDASGKGGSIKRVRENLNPRIARVVALPKPSDAESTQWYFQRYVAHLPSAGHMVLFDRSWYNRGVVEKVFDFTTDVARERFFRQVPDFERMILRDGIYLTKIWLNVGRAEQLRRFLDREKNPLKHWKLSWIDAKGLALWDEYTQAIRETMTRTHSEDAPWTVIRADDKRRARLSVISTILAAVPYAGKDGSALWEVDPDILGGPDLIGIDI